MPSSNRATAHGAPRAFAVVLVAALAWATRAEAQLKPDGFSAERLYQSAPGGGWVAMDDLSMRGGLGGAMAISLGYAHNPLKIATSDGSQRLPVISDQAFTDFGLAITYNRWRLYLDMNMPLVINGQSGRVGAYQLSGPSVGVGSNPDTLADARIGLDARILGGPASPFRLGAGAQLFLPNGKRAEYDTDDTFRAMLRVLFAGDVGLVTYAGHVGVHVRPLDDSPIPGSPQGSELLFGVAAGPRVIVGSRAVTALVVGPELYGETAFRSFFGTTATGLEGLLSGRLEGIGDDGPQLRVKLGAGGGISPHFGAPEWRVVFGLELFDHSTDRDKDGITDGKDACPDTRGIKTDDPKTNGCP